MTTQKTPSSGLNIALWVAQVILASSLIWASSLKLFQSVDKLAAMWPWVAQVPQAMLKFTGIVDMLAGFGLVLPTLLRIKPKLTAVAALGVIVLMVCQCLSHHARGSVSNWGECCFCGPGGIYRMGKGLVISAGM